MPEIVAPVVESPEVKAQPVKKLSFKLQRELDELEKEIPQLESQKAMLEKSLAEGLSDYQEIQKVSESLRVLNQTLDTKSMRWSSGMFFSFSNISWYVS